MTKIQNSNQTIEKNIPFNEQSDVELEQERRDLEQETAESLNSLGQIVRIGDERI